MRKSIVVFLFALLVVVLAIGCGSQSASDKKGAVAPAKAATGSAAMDPQNLPHLTVVTAPLGSGWYPISVLFGEFWMNSVKGLNVSVQEGGSVANIKAISRGVDSNVGWCYTTDLNDARKGAGVFDKVYTDALPIGATYPVWLNIITLPNSKVKSIEDLKKAKGNYGGVGSGSELAAQRLLEGYGFSYADIKAAGGSVEYGNYVDAAQQLQDGIIDVMLAGGSPEVPPVREVEARKQVHLIPAEPAKLQNVLDKGYVYITKRPIPAGTYKGQTEPVPAIAYQSVVVVNRNLPDDLVYIMTREIWANIETIRREQPARGNLMDISTALEGVNIADLHPGAARFYREKGMIK
ncbi:MAG: TAXI family TRAP transporter solute-binding subunit [Acidaminococcales bacterium]|jgi:TRAP transporter TAXI family solute receptor|nr:TAXI family TRAP transporter solute-binding subunit [Acidaminococcales bacterium]